MSLNVDAVIADWRFIAAGVLVFMGVKAAGIYAVARMFKAPQREAVNRAALFAQGGEFAFVLFAAAFAGGVMDARITAVATAIVIISMALTPLVVLALSRFQGEPELPRDGVE